MLVLLQGSLIRAQAILGFDATNSICGLDGKPPPFSGQKFLVVHPGAFSNDAENYLEEEYAVDFTFTQRTDVVPTDRLGAQVLMLPAVGIYAYIEKLRAGAGPGGGLHMDYQLLQICGGTVGGSPLSGGYSWSLPSTANGFHEPPSFRNCDAPQARGPEWFDAEGQDDAITGVSVTMHFGGARRLQTIESMT